MSFNAIRENFPIYSIVDQIWYKPEIAPKTIKIPH